MSQSGTVKFFNASMGFGFIDPQDGSEHVFIHMPTVDHAGPSTLRENQKLSFDLKQGKNGKTSAVNLKTL